MEIFYCRVLSYTKITVYLKYFGHVVEHCYMPLSSDFPLVQIMVKKKKNEQNLSDIPVSSISSTDFPLSNIGAVFLTLSYSFCILTV